MWHKNLVEPDLYYSKQVARRKEMARRTLQLEDSRLLEHIINKTKSVDNLQHYDKETMIRIIEGKHKSLEYARWMRFVRDQRRRKKKLPNGPNRKWIAWQKKQKEIEEAKANYDPFAKRKKDTLLQQSMKMLALDEAKEAKMNVNNLNDEIVEQVEKLTARGEETKEQYSMKPTIIIDKKEDDETGSKMMVEEEKKKIIIETRPPYNDDNVNESKIDNDMMINDKL